MVFAREVVEKTRSNFSAGKCNINRHSILLKLWGIVDTTMPRWWGLDGRRTISLLYSFYEAETIAVQTLYRKECSTTAFSNMLYDKPWHANHYTSLRSDERAALAPRGAFLNAYK